MRQFLKRSRRLCSSSSRRPSRISSRQHSMVSNLLSVKQISIGVNKIDSDTAGSKQEKCDENSNEMKRMLIKICWTKDFIEKNTQPAETVGATKCSQNSATRRTVVLKRIGTFSLWCVTTKYVLQPTSLFVRVRFTAAFLLYFWFWCC